MAAPDAFIGNAPGLDSPATKWFAVTPDDNTDLQAKPRALWIGGAGNVAINNGSQTVTLQSVPAGTLLPLRPDRVMATGTTASGIVALY
jgi:hypothetical protein